MASAGSSRCGRDALTDLADIAFNINVKRDDIRTVRPHDLSEGKGTSIDMIEERRQSASDACYSCLGEQHRVPKGRERRQNLIVTKKNNDCFVNLHRLTHCCLCWCLVDVDSIESHIEECLKARLVEFTKHPLTFEGFCTVDGPNRGHQEWEHAIWYLCPFTSCIDTLMRKRVFHSDNLHWASIAVHNRSIEGDVLTGNKEIAVLGSLLGIYNHLVAHLFDQAPGLCKPRKAIKDARLLCGVNGCSTTFEDPDEDDSFIQYLCHLVNVHHLPVLFSGNGKAKQSVHISDFHGHLPVFRRMQRLEGKGIVSVDCGEEIDDSTTFGCASDEERASSEQSSEACAAETPSTLDFFCHTSPMARRERMVVRQPIESSIRLAPSTSKKRLRKRRHASDVGSQLGKDKPRAHRLSSGKLLGGRRGEHALARYFQGGRRDSKLVRLTVLERLVCKQWELQYRLLSQ